MRKFSVRMSSCMFSHLLEKQFFPWEKGFLTELLKQTYIPMLSLSACKRFWSSFNIVSLVNLWIPLGRYSSKFCDRWRSVRFSSPLIASGISSSLFSDTSRQTRLRKFPIWLGNRWSWLWSSQSSWSDGKSPMCGGSSSISLSPKSNRSNFVNLLIDSGRCFSRFSRNSSDSNCIKLEWNFNYCLVFLHRGLTFLSAGNCLAYRQELSLDGMKGKSIMVLFLDNLIVASALIKSKKQEGAHNELPSPSFFWQVRLSFRLAMPAIQGLSIKIIDYLFSLCGFGMSVMRAHISI